ncbi:type II secretion system F family protein [Mucisphaera sp.]|uniref:type II secretion system F family protein n=1 Tax=Mucisphaera sp. TaxID=2913024 RepID=UPI003D1282B3
MKLVYQALDSQGRMVSDVIEADSTIHASDLLHRKGLFATGFSPANGQSSAGLKKPAKKARSGGARISTNKRLKHISGFARHLHVLLKSGASLVNAIGAVERQTHDGAWSSVLGQLRARLEEGIPLSEAMADHPHYFDAITRSLVAAGESSGKLDEMLSRLSALSHAQLHLRRQVQGALTYPILVLVVGLSMVAMLVTIVLPRFSTLFETMQVPLPPITEALIFSSEFAGRYWWGLLIGLAAIGYGVFAYLTSQTGRRHVQTAMIRTPGLGQVMRGFLTARIARLLGVLLASHVDLLDALRLTGASAGNYHYEALMKEAEERTAQGTSLSTVFTNSDLIPVSLYEAIKNGEETGTTDDLLMTVADFMDEDNEIVLKSVLSLLGPAVLVAIGLLVGFVAVSLFLPLFDLTAATGGGG